MVECRYCGREFDDDSDHSDHLLEVHADELGPIDRRRLESGTGERSRRPLVLAGVVLVLALAVMAGTGYVLLNGGGNDGASGSNGDGASGDTGAVARTPTNVGSVHYHGTIEMRVMGQSVDFSRSEYQLQADAFHFENGEGTRWHAHAQGVTLEYAMSTLGIGVTSDSVTYQGQTYRDTQSTDVIVQVNGRSVTPSEYVLQEGDRVRILVREA